LVKNELSTLINRPIEDVFTYVSDLQNGPQWQTGLFEVRRLSQGSLGIGTQFASVRKFMGKKLEGVVELVVYEPNCKIVIKAPSGSVPFEQTFLFEPTTEGTKLSTVIQLYTSGFMGLAEPMIAASLKREMETAFGDLKNLLESQAVPA
jgi:uncharacterized membrane protein